MVDVAHAGSVVATHFVRVRFVFPRVLPVMEVLVHEFSRGMPGALPVRLLWMRNGRQLDPFVGIHVALRRSKWEVRLNKTDGEKERRVRVGQIFELFEAGIANQAIMVVGVLAFGALHDFHFIFRERPDGFDLTVNQRVHGASWVLPSAGGHELTIPGTRHFENVMVVPVFTAPTSWMVRDFSDGNGLISIFPKPLRHAWRNGCIGGIQLISPSEEGLISIGTVLPG